MAVGGIIICRCKCNSNRCSRDRDKDKDKDKDKPKAKATDRGSIIMGTHNHNSSTVPPHRV